MVEGGAGVDLADIDVKPGDCLSHRGLCMRPRFVVGSLQER
jgi:hypothetical protein